MKLKRILPECDADTLFVKLLLKRGLPNHQKNIHKVAKALELHQDQTLFVIGVIDNDKAKNVPTYIKGFTELVNKEPEEGLAILNLAGTEKYIIRLYPAFEKWILFVAESCDVDPGEFGFYNFEKLRNESKGDGVYNNIPLNKFIKAVISKNPPAIQTLRFWLNKANPENE